MERSVGFTLSADDLVAATRVQWAIGVRSRRMLVIFALLGLGYSALFFFTSNDWDAEALGWGALTGVVVATLLVAVLCAIGLFRSTRRARRLHAQQKSIHGPLEARWDETAITFTAPTGTSRHPWGDFVKWTEFGGGLLLYQNDALFNMLPVRALSRDDRDSIRNALVANGVARVGGAAGARQA